MKRTYRLKAVTSLAGAFLLLGCAPLMLADMQVQWSTDGTTFTTDSACTGASCVGLGITAGNGIAVTALTVGSNSPGSLNSANEESSTFNITNNSNTIENFYLKISSNNFSSPTAPPTLQLDSQIGGTILTPSVDNSLSYYSCVNSSNTLPACPASIVSGTATPDITSGSFPQNDTYAAVTNLSGLYSLGEYIHFTLGASSSLNFTTSTKLSPVPEPGSGILLGSLLWGAGLLFRKKMQAQHS